MSILDLNPQALLTKWGLKIAAGAVALALAFGGGIYFKGKWDGGTIENLKGQVAGKQVAIDIAYGSITNLQGAINAKNKQLEDQKVADAAKVAAAAVAQKEADARAKIAQAKYNGLLSALPKPGQDVILSGLDLVSGSL